MNRNLILLAAVAVFMLVAGCKDEAEHITISKIYFTGILEVDPAGQFLGGNDTTDWRMDDVWVEQEEALFSADAIPLCALPDTLEIYTPQPNPVQTAAYLGFRNIENAVWHFRLVDEDFNVLWTADHTDFRPYYNAIRLETPTFPKDTVRLYYQVERGNCQWHGHGDIVIKS